MPEAGLLGRLRTALLLGNRVLQRIAFFFHLVSPIGASSSRDHIPATRKHRKHGQKHTQGDYSLYSHHNSSNIKQAKQNNLEFILYDRELSIASSSTLFPVCDSARHESGERWIMRRQNRRPDTLGKNESEVR
ncbi:hypothetical protein SAMN06298226_0492 [Nitrosovibrio sp. Nv4]|nr:hypothetical protein SAMN06298226_0492 [Nitrosovibrio sp. Nv4]